MVTLGAPQRLASIPPMAKPLPLKLEKEPLLEGLCELRVNGPIGLHTVVPGLLFMKFPGQVSDLQQLPASSIPDAVRATEPALVHAGLIRLKWKGFLVNVGQRSLNIAATPPYVGWEQFRNDAVLFFRTLLESPGIISGIERYSVKYVNFFPLGEDPAPPNVFDWSVRIGEFQLRTESTNVRIELPQEEFLTILTLATSVTIQQERRPARQGALIDVDTICDYSTADVVGFSQQLTERFDKIRRVNKQVFFDSLNEDAIARMRPTYAH